MYSGLYVNEAADLDDEDFEDLDQPQVVSVNYEIKEGGGMNDCRFWD